MMTENSVDPNQADLGLHWLTCVNSKDKFLTVGSSIYSKTCVKRPLKNR